MTPEERDEIMTAFLSKFEAKGLVFILEDATKEAIVETYRRSRAWDKLRAQLVAQFGLTGATVKKMDELIPPEPADKLERLRQWIMENDVYVSEIISKIKELQDEDR